MTKLFYVIWDGVFVNHSHHLLVGETSQVRLKLSKRLEMLLKAAAAKTTEGPSITALSKGATGEGKHLSLPVSDLWLPCLLRDVLR